MYHCALMLFTIVMSSAVVRYFTTATRYQKKRPLASVRIHAQALKVSETVPGV